MKIYIVIPAHNEAENIFRTLESLTSQSLLPKKLVVVDDQSTDSTASIVERFSEKFPFVRLVKSLSSEAHLPGSKVINAFHKGLKQLDEEYDVICKFDADLIFPKHYLASLAAHFEADKSLGMCGGFCQVQVRGKWVLESLTGKDHIRGALKAYRKACYKDIGGLKASMGWDTVDELLAQYHGWKIKTDPNLLVKHLRPTGFTYNKTAKWKQGEAFYKLRYGWLITIIASVKLALKKKEPRLVLDYLQGFQKAKASKMPFLVSEKEGAFIRRLRYKKMLSKFF
ncbi:glycosyltransferase [Salinimicrobium oceani]|uniref:Glycosyltransferase family 2 protein n=1 Tax=Salinimicrobium oceani TaxID=2722702 RepID=A0ABX1D1G3_9FLAO|nr:glycosyltransferase family A protein [Salinimicrobium oceani]NJW53917.1 glycosyltransferase family 2 protein [Salinimicrobium oceani]